VGPVGHGGNQPVTAVSGTTRLSEEEKERKEKKKEERKKKNSTKEK